MPSAPGTTPALTPAPLAWDPLNRNPALTPAPPATTPAPPAPPTEDDDAAVAEAAAALDLEVERRVQQQLQHLFLRLADAEFAAEAAIREMRRAVTRAELSEYRCSQLEIQIQRYRLEPDSEVDPD